MAIKAKLGEEAGNKLLQEAVYFIGIGTVFTKFTLPMSHGTHFIHQHS